MTSQVNVKGFILEGDGGLFAQVTVTELTGEHLSCFICPVVCNSPQSVTLRVDGEEWKVTKTVWHPDAPANGVVDGKVVMAKSVEWFEGTGETE